MRFDPQVRQEKYAALESIAIKCGFRASIRYGESQPDTMAVWRDPASRTPDGFHQTFWLFSRKRGIFVGYSGSPSYQVFSHAALIDVFRDLEMLCRSEDAETAFDHVIRAHQLTPSDKVQWSLDDDAEKVRSWEAFGWFLLPEILEKEAWQIFMDRLVGPDGNFRLPVPSKTWKISQLRGARRQPRDVASLLTPVVHDILCRCTTSGDCLYVLDWQHHCYRYFPHQGSCKPFRDYWAVRVWPEDSYYFVSPDFTFGYLAAFPNRIHVFGEPLVEIASAPLTELFGRPR